MGPLLEFPVSIVQAEIEAVLETSERRFRSRFTVKQPQMILGICGAALIQGDATVLESDLP